MTNLTTDSTNLLQQRFLNPSVPARLGALVILAFVLVMAGWGAVAPLSGAVMASGVLQAEGGRQAVQHPYGGVISELLVKEGDRVDAGQVLMRLSGAEPRAQVDVLLAERDALLAAQGRLVAERDGAEAPAFAPELLSRQGDASADQVMANETRLMAARAQQFETGQSVFEQQKGQLAERAAAAGAQVQSLTNQYQSLAAEVDNARSLLDQQLIERSRVNELERSLASLEADLAAQNAERAAIDKSMAEIDFEIAGLQRDRLAEVTDALRANQSDLASLAPRLAAAEDALARTEIKAPVSGSVVGLDVVTEGGVIAPGAELMGIIPSDNPLVVEARMQLSDVTDVDTGTSADIRLLAVPATTRPTITGTVETISADRIVDERSGQSFYALQVALNPEDVAAAGVDLQAGMPVQVVIPTRGRTMIDYLISPLVDEIGGAFRER